nr:hypothetical protein [Panacagrimonas sp.]
MSTTSPSFVKASAQENGTAYLYFACNPNSDKWEIGFIPTGPTVSLNGKELSYLVQDTYAPLKLRKGTNSVKVAPNANYSQAALVELLIESGADTYIEYDLGMISGNAATGGVAQSRLQVRPSDVAAQRIAHCQIQTRMVEMQAGS